MDKKGKFSVYFLVPLFTVIILIVLGILYENIIENLPNYDPADDSGLKGLALAVIISPILYFGAIIINAPLMFLITKDIRNAKNIFLKTILIGSVISSLIIAALISKFGPDFLPIYLSFQLFSLLLGIIWAVISWFFLKPLND